MSENKEFLKKTINKALKCGIDDIIARLNKGKIYQIRFSNSMIDNVKIWHNEQLELFLAKKQKTTHLEIQAPSLEKVDKVLEETSSYLEKMPKSFLYSGMEENQKTYQTIKRLYDSRIEDFPEKAPDLINTTIQSSLDVGAEKVAGVLYFGKSLTEQLTSYDIGGSYSNSFFRLTIRAFVDAESSGQDIVCGRNLTDINEKFLKAGEKAGRIAKMAVGGKQGQPGTYDLIMSPTVAANVFGQITDNANPLLMMIEMSPLNNDLLEKKVGSTQINIVDNAIIEDGLSSKPFDVEGTPSSETPIFVDGVFTGVVHNTSTGNMFQSKSTGNSKFYELEVGSKFLAPGPSNTVYKSGNHTLDEIIEESRRPTLYVTSNWYTRFTNMKEGIFSTIPRDGMFLIERGEITKPVRKLRISDNLLRMFANVSVLGNDMQQINWWEVPIPTFIPTIKVEDCRITAATK